MRTDEPFAETWQQFSRPIRRGIGFTKGYDFAIPEGAEIQMEFPQQQTPAGGLG